MLALKTIFGTDFSGTLRRVIMRLRQLQTFCELARTLNFSHTAQRLHYAQSSVVEQLDTLENYFGTALFARTGRRLALTPAGEQLLGYAERILALAAEARTRVGTRGQHRAAMTVMAPETFCARRLPRILKEFHEMNADVTVHVKVAGRTTLLNAVSNNTADICVVLGEAAANDAQTDDNAVQVTRLGEESLLMVASSNHPLAGSVVSIDELIRFPLYATEVGCAYRAAQDAVLSSFTKHPVIVVESIASLVECVATTDGFTLLPEMAVEQAIEQHRIAAINVEPELTVPLHILWRGKSAASHVRHFVELLRSSFQASG